MRRWKGIHIISASLIAIFILLVTVVGTIIQVNKKMTHYCFEELESTSAELAKELYNAAHTDKTIMTAMANIIAGYDNKNNENNESLCYIMNSINAPDSYITYYEILKPNGQILKQNGTEIDATGILDFATECRKGAYISEIEKDLFSIKDKVLRNAIPVQKNGKTIAILYGIVSLSKFAELYKTNIYGGKAYVYLVEGTTGNFFLDTYHNSLGNIKDFTDRKTEKGYSFDTTIQDLKKGKSGNICFISKSTGKTIYLDYTPVGINDWNVLVSIDSESAFHKTNVISTIMYAMSSIISITLVVYMVFIIISITKIYKKMHKLDTEDKNTKLQNRTAYDAYMLSTQNKTFDIITCVFVDANGLHEINNTHGHDAGDKMLRTIANALRSQFSYEFLYRIGGDEFVAVCDGIDINICSEKISNAITEIEKNGYSISVGIVSHTKEVGIEEIIKEADGEMIKNKRMFYSSHNIIHNRIR